jgi:hypothetical protein
MRTPNTECCLCQKPVYRRPFELKQIDFVSCKPCYGEALKKFGSGGHCIGLKKGRGWNKGLTKESGKLTYGRPRGEETKRKISNALKDFCNNNPEKVKERGSKTSGENHYNWKNGASGLQNGIRTLARNQWWIEEVKKRDSYRCVRCMSDQNLEAHHLTPLEELIKKHNITSYRQAKEIDDFFDVSNGISLCIACHYAEHGRAYNENIR